MAPAQPPDKKRLHWDGTVTAGNLLTAASMIVLLMVWGLRLESRVDMIEERAGRSERLADTGTAQIAGMRDTLSRLQADQASMLRALTRIEGILDRAQQQGGTR